MTATSPGADASRHAPGLDGYVADSLYPSNFHAEFAPPNIDAMLAHAGVASPRVPGERAPFTMVDIGCGDGVGLILNAAAHPEGHFIGIDGNPDHVARGQAIAARAGLSNIELHCQYFEDALAMQPRAVADYVQCQGVLAWISEVNQAYVLDLASRILRPGGVAAFGYNCLPGWTPIIPFQAMIRALAATETGTPFQRFDAALAALRTSGLFAEEYWQWIDARRGQLPDDYFAHEYLNGNWMPLWSGHVLEAAAKRDMTLVGQARPYRLRADFALKAAWRAALAQIEGPAARENATDIITNNWFRTDLFVKGATKALGKAEQAAARMAGWWRATKPGPSVAYEAKTTAGTIRFDNDAARAILRALEGGPRPVSAMGDFSKADLFNAIDALFMAGLVAPVDAPGDDRFAVATHAALVESDALMVNGAVSRHGVVTISRGSL